MPGRIPRRGKLGPAPPAGPPPSFGGPVAVMGDPTTVPEDPDLMAPGTGPEPEDPEPEPLWLKLPPELAPFFDLGFVHSEPDCPLVVLRAKDYGPSLVEISGSPVSFLGLAEVIATLCAAVPCIAHDSQGEAAQREAG